LGLEEYDELGSRKIPFFFTGLLIDPIFKRAAFSFSPHTHTLEKTSHFRSSPPGASHVIIIVVAVVKTKSSNPISLSFSL